MELDKLRRRQVARYGWLRDLPDHRDLIYKPAAVKGLEYVDLEPKMPPVYDQGQLGSCTANGIAGVYQYERRQAGIDPDYTPSRLFIYWCERYIEGTIDTDAGAMTRDGIKVVAAVGAPPEEEWGYDISRFREQPPDCAFEAGKLDRVLQYQRVNQTLNDMKASLEDGHPFTIGITAFASFESQEVADSGIVHMPTDTDAVVGGHCMAAVGFNDATQQFKVRNSYGRVWGQRGYCWMPYAYLGNAKLASDFWSIRLVEKLAGE